MCACDVMLLWGPSLVPLLNSGPVWPGAPPAIYERLLGRRQLYPPPETP